MSLVSSKKTDVNTTELELFIDPETFTKAVEAEYEKWEKESKDTAPDKRVICENAINTLIGPELDAAIQETGLVLVAPPKVDVIPTSDNEGVKLTAVCTTKPEITIDGYKGIQVKSGAAEITQEDIDKQTEILRKKNARKVAVTDRAAQPDDEVIIDFEGFFGNNEAFEGGKADDHPLRLGSGTFIPGFEDQVVGHNIGDNFDVVVPFPDNYPMADFAGKEATFKCKLKGINQYELPELTDELVKELTSYETVADFTAYVKEHLEKSAEAQAKADFENAVMNALVEKVTVPIPECMFEQRLDAILQSFEADIAKQGMNMELYFKYTGTNEAEFRESFRERAKSEVKLSLAFEKIAELENLTVSEDELETALGRLAITNNIEVKDIRNYVPAEEFREELRLQKAAEIVLKNASVL